MALPQLRRWASGLLDFVLWMHDGDGRWFNFIYDWEGQRNFGGSTSAPGSNFWQARATEAMAVAAPAFDRPEARRALAAALRVAAESSPAADVRAVHALAALELLGAAGDPWLLSQLDRWSDELVACTSGGVLQNWSGERGRPHLWGHVQEAALVGAARLLGRGELAAVACRSAGAVFGEVIESGFDRPHVQPYDVQSAVLVMDRLAAETGDAGHAGSAAKARAWFSHRNPARAAVYMREEGRVADGIDEARVNSHSGAEANISAGLALIDDPFVVAQAAAWSGPSGAAW